MLVQNFQATDLRLGCRGRGHRGSARAQKPQNTRRPATLRCELRSGIPVTHPEVCRDCQSVIASAMYGESASQGLDQMLQSFGLAFYFLHNPQNGFRKVGFAIERNCKFFGGGPGTDMYACFCRVQQYQADCLFQDLVNKGFHEVRYAVRQVLQVGSDRGAIAQTYRHADHFAQRHFLKLQWRDLSGETANLFCEVVQSLFQAFNLSMSSIG